MNSGSRAMGLVVSWCLFVWLWVAPANGHVLEGPHVLDLMVRKLAGAQTLRVDQLVTVEDSAIASQPIDLEESLSFIFLVCFRSDSQHEIIVKTAT